MGADIVNQAMSIHFSNFFEIFSKTVFQNALLDSY